jgi:hypothetical protein
MDEIVLKLRMDLPGFRCPRLASRRATSATRRRLSSMVRIHSSRLGVGCARLKPGRRKGDEMGSHIVYGEFQSDKYPNTPRGKVPLSVKDPSAQDLLWEYAQRRRVVDAEFADDLEAALRSAGWNGPGRDRCTECGELYELRLSLPTDDDICGACNNDGSIVREGGDPPARP